MAKILISGGSGLVGRALTAALLAQGHAVAWLSRSSKAEQVPAYAIDLNKGYIDPKAFEGCDVLINLAGAGIVAQAWTDAYKKELIDSRIKTVALLEKYIQQNPHQIKLFIGASATGYYGTAISEKLYDETSPAGNDFMAEICERWESVYEQIKPLVPRQLVFRIGVVLSKQGGALEKMMPPFKLGLGSSLAGGKQYFPWIHIDDLCQMIIFGINQSHVEGTYNAVAPEIINNHTFSKSLAKALHRPFFVPSVPGWTLKLMLGERHVAVSRGLKISGEKIVKAGYSFKYPGIREALASLKIGVTN